MTEFTILQPGDPIDGIKGPVGLLFECAPDSRVRRNNPDALALPELIGDFDVIKRRANGLAAVLLNGEPKFREVAQLGIFEENVIRELQYAFHALHLWRQLDTLGVETCRFLRESRFSQVLAWLSRAFDPGMRIVVPAASERSPLARSLANSRRRLIRSRYSVSGMREELDQLLRRIDPFHKRARMTRWHRRGQCKHHGIWFYSTAYSFTRIGLSYEPYFPEPFSYLIENARTGGRALDEMGRDYVRLYDFSVNGLEPSRHETSTVAAEIIRHLRSVYLSGDDAAARDILSGSQWLAQFFERLLPSGLFQSGLFERWAEMTRPAVLVVGNPGFERYALLAAARREIPRILLQHGVLGDFCQFSDPPVSRYVVRGEFWREFLSPAAQAKSVVLNVPYSEVPREPQKVVSGGSRKHILFITAPYDSQEFWQEDDLNEILLVLLRTAGATSTSLVIRVHPLEQVDAYRSRVRDLLPNCNAGVDVFYSQGPGAEDVVAKASVAVLFSSTMFLDCLRLHVPAIAIGWHDFSYKKQINCHAALHFASDMKELDRLVTAGVSATLSTWKGGTDDFLALTDAAQARATFAQLAGK